MVVVRRKLLNGRHGGLRAGEPARDIDPARLAITGLVMVLMVRGHIQEYLHRESLTEAVTDKSGDYSRGREHASMRSSIRVTMTRIGSK